MDDEGAVEDDDASQIAGLPWVFDDASGELLHFLGSLEGEIANKATFERDAAIFERCFSLDVRFQHSHNHDHDCSSTCVKNQKKKTLEQLARVLAANRAPPCRFDFSHVVELVRPAGAKLKIRRRGKELVHQVHISSAMARNHVWLGGRRTAAAV